jgi:hypothetical protein
MALKPYKECREGVSSWASKCPHCGAKNPTLTTEQVWVSWVVIFSVLILSVWSCSKSEQIETKPVLTVKEQRTQVIEKAFDRWDGSHIALTKIIKSAMNDPSSYKHIETRYFLVQMALAVWCVVL